MSDEPINWESIAKERLDAIVQFKARAESAEARVKVLEEALRKIADGKCHDNEADAQYGQSCHCAEYLAQATLFKAKEKP